MNENEIKETEQSVEAFKVPPIMPTIEFKTPTPEPKKSIVPTAGEMVEHAFNEAVVATVKNDERVQCELLEGAEKVIHNKTSEIKARAEMEEKEAHFNNKKGACECFGYNETTTEKWAVSVMGMWHNIITALWIVLGMFTFAPVTFVAKKLSVIIKNTWLAVAVAVAIYGIFALSPLWIGLIAKIGGAA